MASKSDTVERLVKGFDQKMVGAHVLSYVLAHGEILKGLGLQVLHRCDVRLCVRPDHLFLGTQRDNMDDMAMKGRNFLGFRLNPPQQQGEDNPSAKLTNIIVKEIRELHASGMSQVNIAALTGVPKGNVWAVVNRQSWTHI